MNLRDLLGTLAFRTHSLRAQADRQALVPGVVLFTIGFFLFSFTRNSVYAALPDAGGQIGVFGSLVHLLATVLFFLLIYVPATMFLSRAIRGGGFRFADFRREHRSQASAMLPLWGLLFLADAPLQYFAPQFLVIGVVGISIGMLVLLPLFVAYTVWGIRQLNALNLVQAVGVFALSGLTFPVYYLLTLIP